jgi:hypothetical protein
VARTSPTQIKPQTTGRKTFEESFLVDATINGPMTMAQEASAYELRIETCSSRTSRKAKSKKYPITPPTPKFM